MPLRFSLRQYRQGKVGMRALARATGIAPSTLSYLERNQTERLELKTLERLIAYFRAQGLPCDLGDLLVYEDEEPDGRRDPGE